MLTLKTLFENNRQWSKRIQTQDPDYFLRLSLNQAPRYLWIGCSDSRVPANEIVGLSSGELFVHRNVANIVVHTDLNCLSVIQYAVDVLEVQHIIVCGHYGCGGVHAALMNSKLGLIDNWLRHTQDVMQKHARLLSRYPEGSERVNVLCELNVIEQVVNVSQTTIVQQAWERGQSLSVHGWVYSLHNGLLQDLKMCVRNDNELDMVYAHAVSDLKLHNRERDPLL